MPDEVRDAADLGEQVVAEAALGEAKGEQVEVALVEQHHRAAGGQQQPVRRLAPRDAAPVSAAAQLDEEQRRGQGGRRLARREGEDEEQAADRPVGVAQIGEQCREVERRHQRGGAAADVGHRFGLHGMEREEQRRDQYSE